MFDIHRKVDLEDESQTQSYLEDLVEEFSKAPENTSGIHYAPIFLDYLANYGGILPPKATLRDFNDILFDVVPRKVSCAADEAPALVAELRALWSFLDRQYQLPHAARIAASLDRHAVNVLEGRLADPGNFGLAKSFIMAGKEAGYAMTSQEDLDKFSLEYNARLRLHDSLHPSTNLGFGGFDDRDYMFSSLGVTHSVPLKDRRKERKKQRQAKKRNRR